MEPNNIQQKTTLEWAEKYLNFGFSVIPLPSRMKAPPALAGWKRFQHSRPTLDELKKWWSEKDRNIAILTGPISGIVVVDIDNPAGEATMQTKGFSRTPSVKTMNGRHYYFRHPEEFVPNVVWKKNHNWPFGGIDIRGRGGYVVAPPSIHPDGGLYEWEIEPGECPFAELPEWLGRELKKVARRQGRKYDLAPNLEEEMLRSSMKSTEMGNRNVNGFELARKMRDTGVSKSDAEKTLLKFQRIVPQADGQEYTKEEALASVRSSYDLAKGVGILDSYLFKTTDAAFRRKDLTPQEKLILICLAYHGIVDGEGIRPSQSRIGTMTGYARTTVFKYLQQLEERNLVISQIQIDEC